MSNQAELLYEIAKNTRKTYEGMCCTYNTLAQVALSAAGTKTFAIKSAHSIAWDLGTSASITIAIDGGTAVSYTKNGSIEFSGLNANSIVLTAVGGSVSVMWTY